MPLRLITGPANAGKTGEVLKEALAAAAAGASPVIAVPNLADVRRLEVELSGKAPLGVRVMTLRQLMRELWSLHGDGRRIVDDPTRDLVVRRVVSCRLDESIATAAGAPGFSRLMVRMAKKSPAKPCAGAESGAADEALLDLVAEYRRELARADLVESGWLADLLVAAGPRLDGPLGVMRFDSLAADEIRFLAGLSRLNEITVALTWEHMFAPTRANDAAVNYLAGVAHTHIEMPDVAGGGEIQTLARNLSDGPRALESEGAVTVGLASGDEAEAALIARIVRDEIADGVVPERVVVAFPHAARRARAMGSALLSYGVSAELDVGMPFGATGFGRAWRSLISLASGRGDRSEAMTFLASPYSGETRQSVHEFDRKLRKGRVREPRVLLASLGHRDAACAFPVTLAIQAVSQRLAAANIRKWQELSDAMLNIASTERTVGMTGEVESEDVAAHQALGRLLAQMAESESAPFSADDVLAATGAITVSLPSTEAPGRVQVCEFARLGARRFDVVVLGGLTEGEISLVTKESADGLILDDLSRELEGEVGDCARLQFYSLVSRARRKLYLVRQEVDSEGRERRASALLEDVMDAYRPIGASAEEDIAMPLPCIRLTRADIEELAPALTSGRREARESADKLLLATPGRGAVRSDLGLGGLASTRIFSATEIEAYLACPYKWFFERVVRPEEIDEVLDARGLGTYAHGLLAEFYRRLLKDLGRTRVEAEWLGEALDLFDRVAAEGAKTVAVGLSEEMQLARAVGWARNVVGQDATFLPGFAPELVEFGFGDEVPFMFAGHAFRGRIDRIDSAPDSVFVTDYKSSREVTGLKKLEADGKVQAVIYSCAAEYVLRRPVCGSVYRSMRSGRLGGFWRHDMLGAMPAGMCEDDALGAGEFAALVARTEERVAEAISGMQSGQIPRSPAVKGACKYCSLSAICEGARP